ncbi:MAG: alpha-1,2-fucosyltransferase [Hespellia sp.]|nr:alpha-1,2-fucosyltransferase [Hespellia sp.]
MSFSKRKKIVLMTRSGQMCNQLLSLAALYTIGLEYGYDTTCPVIDERLKEYFEFNSPNDNIIISFYNSPSAELYMQITKKIIALLGVKTKATLDLRKKRKQVFYDWISFLDNKVFTKHTGEIRTFFKISADIEERCKRMLTEKNKILVGVHIRRGDYKEYLNGKYFYDDDCYIKWLTNLKEQSKEEVCFVLCSNEKIDIKKYEEAGLDVCAPGTSSVEDLCYLSLCDYVMGPPSSYSFWAAMYGNKPRCILDDRNQCYAWEAFKYFEDRLQAGDYIR